MSRKKWIELKECPFCGMHANQPEDRNRSASGDQLGRPDWTIHCSACCVTMHATTKREVIESWNKRATKADNS
jgi:Lar family restriction alleviation protein